MKVPRKNAFVLEIVVNAKFKQRDKRAGRYLKCYKHLVVATDNFN